MELVGGYLFSTSVMPSVFYNIGTTIEELFEMLGIVVFVHALISYIKTYLGGVSWNIYIPGKNTEITEAENINLPGINEPANTNLLR